jgi:chromosomal replication initiation ATPase DnaA
MPDELCYTIEQALERGAQVVISDRTDRSALRQRLPAQLRTLVEAGYAASLPQPRTETLVRYVSSESTRLQLGLEPATCAYLVEQTLRDTHPPSGPIPLLATALQHIAGKVEMLRAGGLAPSDRTAWSVLCNAAAREGTQNLHRQDNQGHTPDRIIALTVGYFGLTVPALLSKRRDPWTVQARQLAMYMLCEDNGMGVTKAGRLLGRDHSTVLHGIAQVKRVLAEGDMETTEALRDIRARLRETTT